MNTCPACDRALAEGESKCPSCHCHIPGLEEIRAACCAIQQTWSKTEERKRCTSNPVPAEIKVATLVRYREDD